MAERHYDTPQLDIVTRMKIAADVDLREVAETLAFVRQWADHGHSLLVRSFEDGRTEANRAELRRESLRELERIVERLTDHRI